MNNEIVILKQGTPPTCSYKGTCRICGCEFVVAAWRVVQGCEVRWAHMEGGDKPAGHPCPQHGCGNTQVCMLPYAKEKSAPWQR